MKLFVAKNSGFCKGVKSAVETAMNIDPVNTFLLGELVPLSRGRRTSSTD